MPKKKWTPFAVGGEGDAARDRAGACGLRKGTADLIRVRDGCDIADSKTGETLDPKTGRPIEATT